MSGPCSSDINVKLDFQSRRAAKSHPQDERRILWPLFLEKTLLLSAGTARGLKSGATSLRLTRYLVVFEVYNPYSILQLSEVLLDFKIFMNEKMAYSGRAVVSNLVNTGTILICEASLEDGWVDVDIFSSMFTPGMIRQRVRAGNSCANGTRFIR